MDLAKATLKEIGEVLKNEPETTYTGFSSVVKRGQAEELVSTTEKPFSWFPKLKTLFKNFKIEEITIELDLKEQPSMDEKVIRQIFSIKKI